MLSGQYDFLVDNMWLTEIIGILLLILPFFLLFMNKKWVFFYYTISIVANLPLIFSMTFNFSYELIIGVIVLVIIAKDILIKRGFRIITTKENLIMILLLILVMGLNLGFSLFNFNKLEFINRLSIY